MEKNLFQAPNIESETIEKLTKQLMIANNELQRMQKERGEMLANISHDLRAPITAIRSAIDVLLQDTEPSAKELASTLHIIDRRTKTLENMIQDMYYLFCVEDVSKDLAFETVNAAAFFEEYFFDAIVDTRYNEHNMNLDIADDLICTINIDLQKMVRVLDNLFTNAAKYSPAGTDITLKVTFHEDGHNLLVEVIDNGVGIPEDALARIFNRTYTVSSSRTPNSDTGSGLGLSIVKAIVERHHGSINCTSKEGEGCCFSFTLPCKKTTNFCHK